MKRSQLLKNAPCSMPEGIDAGNNVIAVSRIVEASGQQAVEIDLFYKGELRGRYFADEWVHNAWVDGVWYSCSLDNVARLCMDKTPLKTAYYYRNAEWRWASDNDKDTALNFLGAWDMDNYEVGLGEKKKERARERKRERIREEMDLVPCVPEDAERWVEDELFAGHFLFVRKKEKRIVYGCTACGRSVWKKAGWKQGEKTACPRCGHLVTVEKRGEVREAKAPAVILQRYGSKWVERQFKAVCKWTAAGKKVELFEQCRAIIPEGQCWGKVYYGVYTEENERGQEFWDKNPMNKRFLSSYLYPGNLREVLKCGNLENSGMDILADRKQRFNVNKYITTFHQRPYLEYLVKAGLTRMAADVVDSYGWWGDPGTIDIYAGNIQEALRLDGNRVNRIKQLNGGLNVLEWLQREEGMGVRISEESLRYLSDKNLSVRECGGLLKSAGSVNRMVNYIKKQKLPARKVMIIWEDYLRMAENEGMDIMDDIVRFPRDLKARHDQLVELANERRDAKRLEEYAELDRRIRDRLPEARKYFWENGEYMIIPAAKTEELMKEGRTLHHCVGASDRYMRKMAEGTSWILFLRKKEELEKSYYTIEISMEDDRIIQYRSEFNRQPDKEAIDRALAKFKKSLKRDRVQVRIPVAVTA